MFIDGFGGPGDPVQMVTPFLLALVIFALAALILPRNFIDRLAHRLVSVGAFGMAALFGISILLVEVMAPDGLVLPIYLQF